MKPAGARSKLKNKAEASGGQHQADPLLKADQEGVACLRQGGPGFVVLLQLRKVSHQSPKPRLGLPGRLGDQGGPGRGRRDREAPCLMQRSTINDYMLPADHDRTQEHRTPSATRSRNWQAAPKESNDTRPSAPSTKGQRNPERSAQKSGRQRTGEGAISGRPVSTQPATSSKLSKHKTQADQAAKLLAGR